MHSRFKFIMNNNFFNLKKFEKDITFGFFSALGGVSKGNYQSLNCSRNSKDKKENVKKNIDIAIKSLSIHNKKLKLINQIHSNKIIEITKKNFADEFNGDGLITRDKELSLAVLTADCAPIFLFDIKSNIICCLHSGWKGTLSNIIKKSIKKFLSKNVSPKNLVAVVGPCLSFKNYEVKKNFKLKFINKNNLYADYFKYKNNNRDLFDLRGIINFQLKSGGVRNIYNINRDTYNKNNTFFSNRRSTHQNIIDTGRMINIISFKD